MLCTNVCCNSVRFEAVLAGQIPILSSYISLVCLRIPSLITQSVSFDKTSRNIVLIFFAIAACVCLTLIL